MVKEQIANKRILETSKKKSLDAVIAVPAYREGYAVIDMLYSIATQKGLPENFKYAVFVVINNNPHDPKEVYRSNMRTYTLLQALRSGEKIKIEDNADFDNEEHYTGINKKIQKIQKSGLEINIIDIFSEDYANYNNNVGLARQAVAETAMLYLKDSDTSVYITTDADTTLDREFLKGVVQFFKEFPQIDAVAGNIQVNTDIVTKESKQAYEDSLLHQQLSFYTHEFARIQRENSKEDDPHYIKKTKASYLCGSATVVTKKAMDAIDGYHPIASAEDMQIGIDLREKGYAVADARLAPSIKVYTSARISDRTDKGFGRTIESWSKVPFAKHLVPTFEAEENRENLLNILADIHEDKNCEGECVDRRVKQATQSFGLSNTEYEQVLHAYKKGEVTLTLFTNTLLLGITKHIFEQSQYTIPIEQYIFEAEARIQNSKWATRWNEYCKEESGKNELRSRARCVVDFVRMLTKEANLH